MRLYVTAASCREWPGQPQNHELGHDENQEKMLSTPGKQQVVSARVYCLEEERFHESIHCLFLWRVSAPRVITLRAASTSQCPDAASSQGEPRGAPLPWSPKRGASQAVPRGRRRAKHPAAPSRCTVGAFVTRRAADGTRPLPAGPEHGSEDTRLLPLDAEMCPSGPTCLHGDGWKARYPENLFV